MRNVNSVTNTPGSTKQAGLNIHAQRAVAYVVLIFISLLCLFWFYLLFVNSTRTGANLTRGFKFLPEGDLITNWKGLRTHGNLPIGNGLLNSFIIAASSAIVSTYFSTMTAYAIHAYDFKFKKAVFTFILAIMTIPTQVSTLGFIQLIDSMKLKNTFIPLIVPSIAAPAVFFYLKQYMDSTLPLSLIEAARIDGSGEFRTFNTISLPLMKPAIAVQAIFGFVTSWNNYFVPAFVLTKDKMKTLPILIATLRSADYLKFDMGQVYTMISFSIFPVVLVYVLLSKYIVQGVALGSVKG